MDDLTVAKRLEVADKLKAIGNEQFKTKNWKVAEDKYAKALCYLDKFDKEPAKADGSEGIHKIKIFELDVELNRLSEGTFESLLEASRWKTFFWIFNDFF